MLVGRKLIPTLISSFHILNKNKTEPKREATMSKKLLLTFILMTLIVLMCSVSQETRAVANPASVFCKEKGGNLIISSSNGRGDYGVCFFPDSKQCEEWAMMWGYCPLGGIDVTDLTSEESHCLIRGGVLLNNGTQCKLFTGKICNLKEIGRAHV